MILYEDAQLVVCCKPRGVLSAADSSGRESMASLLAPRTVFPVHRLDRDVPGVMVFAKTREAAAFLGAPHGRQGISRTGRGRAVQRAGGAL